MFEGKYFLFRLENGIGTLTLNRPPYNIFEAGLYVELDEVESYIAKQEGIRCLIVNAEGKCFSAGIDLNYLQNVSSAYVQTYKRRLMQAGVIESPGRGLVRFAIPYLKKYLQEDS